MSGPLVFIHNPKAGGSSIHHFLRSQFTDADVGPAINNSPHEREAEGWRRCEGCKYVRGHFGYEIPEQLGADTIISNFRDPVIRIVSIYDYWRSLGASFAQAYPNTGPALIKDMTFAEFIRIDVEPLKFYVEDFHTRQLLQCGWLPRTLSLNDIDIVKRRIDALTWFYVAEHPALSTRWFHRMFPQWATIYDGHERVNVTSVPNPTTPSPSDIDVLVERNRADLEVYAHALSRLAAS